MKNQLMSNETKNKDIPITAHHNHEFKNMLTHFWSMLDFPHHQDLASLEPKIEVSEGKDSVKVLAELPGINEQDLDLQISSDGYLTITGEKRDAKEENYKGNYFSELSYGLVKRTIPLPWDLDFDKANANYDNGILDISIPKTQTEKQKIKKINVKKAK